MRKLKLAGFCFIVGLLFILGTVTQATERHDTFFATFGPNGFQSGGGTGYVAPTGDGPWFEYYNFQPGVWNQWFYDDPPSLDRYKVVDLYFNIIPIVGAGPTEFRVWGNASLPEWEKGPPEQGGFPPGPNDEQYIGRLLLEAGLGENYYHLIIYDFNPEWISIDVQGSNFMIAGEIYHECLDNVPLPGAVLLLGSGLIGLVGIGRKLLG